MTLATAASAFQVLLWVRVVVVAFDASLDTKCNKSASALQRIIHFEAIRVTVQFDDPSYELSGDPQLLHCELPTESENWPSGQSLHVDSPSVES